MAGLRWTRPPFPSSNRVLRSAPQISRMLKISSQWLVSLRAAETQSSQTDSWKLGLEWAFLRRDIEDFAPAQDWRTACASSCGHHLFHWMARNFEHVAGAGRSYSASNRLYPPWTHTHRLVHRRRRRTERKARPARRESGLQRFIFR